MRIVAVFAIVIVVVVVGMARAPVHLVFYFLTSVSVKLTVGCTAFDGYADIWRKIHSDIFVV